MDLVKELALPGELTQNRSYDFEFMQVEKPYESYTGANVRLRYTHSALLCQRGASVILLMCVCLACDCELIQDQPLGSKLPAAISSSVLLSHCSRLQIVLRLQLLCQYHSIITV